jgi:hypothetical protein
VTCIAKTRSVVREQHTCQPLKMAQTQNKYAQYPHVFTIKVFIPSRQDSIGLQHHVEVGTDSVSFPAAKESGPAPDSKG